MALAVLIFGLILSFIIVSGKLTSEHAKDKEYRRFSFNADATYDRYQRLLVHDARETQIRKMINHRLENCCGDVGEAESLFALIAPELEYIGQGDEQVVSCFKERVFCYSEEYPHEYEWLMWLILSHFGVLPKMSFICGERFAGNPPYYEGEFFEPSQVQYYDISVRVFQCLENNLSKATGEPIRFGISDGEKTERTQWWVKAGHSIKDVKYYTAELCLLGTQNRPLNHVYDSVDLPFTPLTVDDMRAVCFPEKIFC